MSTEEPTSVDGDWEAVGRAIRQRLGDLHLQWQDLVERSNVSDSTVREIGHNRVQRRRHPSTLVAISKALDLAPSYLGEILAGRISNLPPSDEVLVALQELRAEVKLLRERMDAWEESSRLR